MQMIHSQGAGGGGSFGGGGGSGGSFGGGGSSGGSSSGGWSGGIGWNGGSYYGKPCEGDECRKGWIIGGSIIGGIIGLPCLYIFGLWLCNMCRSCKLKLSRRKETVIQLQTIRRTELMNIYQSGTYGMRYYQYSRWHGPHLVDLRFENECVTGNGVDDVGSFIVKGYYSEKTNQLTLEKQYQRGTGNLRENLGHQVNLQLQWNDSQQRFIGKWSVKTATYSGEDKFELYFHQYMEKV